MLSLLFKYRHPCLLGLLALLGLACANLATTLLGMRLNSGSQALPARSVAARPTVSGAGAADLAYVLQHHLFDPASRTATAPAFLLQPEDAAAGSVAAASNFQLVGTVVAGKRSIAVLRSGQQVKSYRLGEELPGGGKIEEIARHQVKIRSASQALTTLSMHEEGRIAPPAMETRATTEGGAIQSAGENRWVIPRTTADSVRDNLGEQLRLAQMQPRIVNGRTDGFVIKKINMGSLLSQMGLKRGDVLKRVNSMTLDTPEKALQILQQLREARQLGIDLERDGKPLSFAYAIE